VRARDGCGFGVAVARFLPVVGGVIRCDMTARTERQSRPELPLNDPARGIRLQRVMADAGVAARRVCEALIRDGHVSINGKLVTDLPIFVDPVEDRIVVNGKALPRATKRGGHDGHIGRRLYIMLNKPPRTVSTTADEEGLARRTVTDLVKHPSGARLYPVGRLDFETTGLILLTNDGELANRLSHPKFGIAKTYEVVVKGRIEDEALGQLEDQLNKFQRRARRKLDPSRDLGRVVSAGNPLARMPKNNLGQPALGGASGHCLPPESASGEHASDDDGAESGSGSDLAVPGADVAGARTGLSRRERAAPTAQRAVELRIVNRGPDRTVLEVTLYEARNRQVRQMLAAAGLNIKKLTRTAIGPVKLRELAVGAWRELDRDELKALRRSATEGGTNRVPVLKAAGPRRAAGARPGGSRGGGSRNSTARRPSTRESDARAESARRAAARGPGPRDVRSGGEGESASRPARGWTVKPGWSAGPTKKQPRDDE
jgi:16S rRNA U516 pseudouridylate synthase RsuA-like enzyme